jgi:hypothetical protein
MIQSIAYLEGKRNITTNDLFVVTKGRLDVLDYCCLKNKYLVMQKDNRFNVERMESERF